jgi:diacylglycerol kinase family enzyme
VFFLNESRLHSIQSDSLGELPDEYQFDFNSYDAEGHIIVSVLSGKCLADGFYEQVVAPLLDYFDLSSRYKVHKTTSATTVTELAQKVFLPAATEGKKQHIVLLSGDGGIVDIINELLTGDGLPEAYQPPVVSLIPMGTGNALAHSSKIFDGTNGLASWLRGKPRDLPLIRVEFSHAKEGATLLSDEGRHREDLVTRTASKSYFWGAVVFSWGFHAQIVADSDTPEFRKHGIERFKMAAQEALFPSDGSGPHKYRGAVTIETRDEQNALSWERVGGGEHCYVLGTLVSNLEEHFMISPKSLPFNGKICLVHIKHAEDGKEIVRIMGLAYQRGKHVEDSEVDYLEVDGFAVHFEEEDEKWRRVCVDGKIILVEKGGSVQVHPEKRVAVQLTSLL